MRRTLLALLVAAAPALLGAQREPPPDARALTVPPEVRREVAARWNAASALRSSARLEIDAEHEVRGDVAVQNGPLVIAGHVAGNVLALNADVTLRPSAHIEGTLLVVGGDVDRQGVARVDGGVRIYRQALAYRIAGDTIVVLDAAVAADENWWRRLQQYHEDNWSEALRVVQAGPYNRVEGLPVELGPVVHRRTSWGSMRVDAAAIIRTGSTFKSDKGDVGDKLRAEFRFGQDRGVGAGAQAFSVVDPVESWQLTDLEVALASFLAHRDYRDYYQRHGGSGFLTLYGAPNVSLTGAYGEERWSSRVVSNPITVFNGDATWRPNPAVDEGLFHVATATFKFDTRNDPDDPWSGWYVNADLEHGRGSDLSPAPGSGIVATSNRDVTDYMRGLFDFRRYNRLGPNAQLNMRVVLGGWMSGDPLPLERRMSVDGPGTLPGFGFRDVGPGADVGACDAGATIPGRPADCDRIALAQIEYRGDVHLNFTGDWEDWPRHFHSAHGDVVWVLFANAGRGWKVGVPDGSLTYDRNTLPAVSTFRSDLGGGLDFAGIGIYAAKAISTPREPVNFFVRLRHRF